MSGEKTKVSRIPAGDGLTNLAGPGGLGGLSEAQARSRAGTKKENMNLAIFTLFEGDYHLGVAALINSAAACGFRGRFFVFYRDRLPPWFSPELDRSLQQSGIQLVFEACNPPRHLGYHKPFAARQILAEHPDLDGIVYADPDVAFLAPWPFFTKWVSAGVALCLDCNYPWIHKNHPWRYEWRALAKRAGLTIRQEPAEYPNGGFFALRSDDREFLEHWIAGILQFEKEGGNTGQYAMAARPGAISSDQDILATSLYAATTEPSYLGLEGMGFNGHFLILSHAVEGPKPWRWCSVKEAVRGKKPTMGVKIWLRNSHDPIPAISRSTLFLKKVDLSLGLLISRFWSS
jgi:hypothetical protein